MDLRDSRFLVAGATGAPGSRLAAALIAEGARVALAGRDFDRLAERFGDAPRLPLDLAAPDAAVNGAVEALGGLDGLVIATGAVAFGGAGELPDEVARELMEVNALGLIGLVRAALSHFGDAGAVVALSAIVADHPTARMTAYSASKAALSAYLRALCLERRRHGLTVLDVRPPHLDTDFATRALWGEPPILPEPHDPDALVAAVIAALREDRREIAYDLKARELVTR